MFCLYIYLSFVYVILEPFETLFIINFGKLYLRRTMLDIFRFVEYYRDLNIPLLISIIEIAARVVVIVSIIVVFRRVIFSCVKCIIYLCSSALYVFYWLIYDYSLLFIHLFNIYFFFIIGNSLIVKLFFFLYSFVWRLELHTNRVARIMTFWNGIYAWLLF